MDIALPSTGIAILSKWSVRKEVEDGRLKIVNLKEGGLTRSLSLVSSKKTRLSHADKEFILFVKNYPLENF